MEAVAHVPRVGRRIALEGGSLVVVGGGTGQAEVDRLVAVVEAERLARERGPRGGADGVFLLAAAGIVNRVVEVHRRCRGEHQPVLAVEGQREVEVHPGIPIAIDVDRLCGGDTRLAVVGVAGGQGIVRDVPPRTAVELSLLALQPLIGAVVEGHVAVELALEVGIAHRDVQGVGRVGAAEQARDGGSRRGEGEVEVQPVAERGRAALQLEVELRKPVAGGEMLRVVGGAVVEAVRFVNEVGAHRHVPRRECAEVLVLHIFVPLPVEGQLMAPVVEGGLVGVVGIEGLQQALHLRRQPAEVLAFGFRQELQTVERVVAHGALELQGVAGVQIDVARPVPEVFEAGLRGGVLLVEVVVAVAKIGLHRLLLEVVVDEMVELTLLGVDVLHMAVDGEAVSRLGNLDERPVGGTHVASVGVATGLLSVAPDEVAHGGRPFGREEAVEHFGIVAQGFHAKGAVAVVGVVVIVRIAEPGGEAGTVVGGLVRILPIVSGGKVEARRLLPAGHGVVHVAAGKEIGGGASPRVVVVGVGGIHIAFQLETVALVVDAVVQSAPLRGRQSTRRVEVAPSAVAVGFAAIVHIVEVAVHA